MTRFIKAAPVIVITFIIGVLAFLLWARLYPKPLSLCEIARNPERYDGRLVRIETLGCFTPRFGVKERNVDVGIFRNV